MIECLKILRNWAGDRRFVCKAEAGTEHSHADQSDFIHLLPEDARVSESDALGCVWLLQNVLEVYYTSGEFHIVTYQEAHRRYVPDTAWPVGQSINIEVALDIGLMAALVERFDEIRFTGLEVESVKASAHTDDFAFEYNFDATPWLEQATDVEIIALARYDWGGGFPADDVARFFTSGDHEDDRLALMFRYIELANRGFECYVNGGDARRWVAEHRPYLVRLLDK